MDYRKQMIVNPGRRLNLKDADPAFKGRHKTHEAAAPELERYRQKLIQLQALLYAEKKHSVLIVLQALDAGGKDGTIKHVSVRSIRKGHRWPASNCQRQSNAIMTSSGVSTRMPRQKDGWQSSIAPITRMSW